MSPKRLCIVLLGAAISMAAADPPYAGKWKMNPAKSDFGEMTLTYEQLPSGEMQGTMEGQSYKFKMDGKDYTGPFGNTASWKTVNATTWETTWKLNGKVLYTDTLTLSPDGKSLTVNSRGTKPNGDPLDNTIMLHRVTGGPGLAGKWKTHHLQTRSPSQMELSPSGMDALTFKIVDMGLTCESKLDGNDYPCTGPTVAPGWTIALAKMGDRSLDMTVKHKDKPFYKATYTVSADGKTLTEMGGAIATGEKIKVVYDRVPPLS